MLPLLLACYTAPTSGDYLSVVSITPGHGAVNVPVDADIRVVFSQDLLAVDSSMIGLYDQLGEPVTVAIEYDEAYGDMLIIDPADDLVAQASYQLRLEPLIEGEGGTLAAPVRVWFSTGSQLVEADADTDSDTDADTDADADADSDSDTDADSDATFQPAYALFGFRAALDADVAFTEVNGQDPRMIVEFQEEAPDGQDCTWFGAMNQGDPDNLGQNGSWGGWEVVLYDQGLSDCAGFPTSDWSDGFPQEVMETQVWGVGLGPMSPGFESQVQKHYEEAGLNFEADRPYLLSGFVAVGPELAGREVAYGFGYRLDDAGEIELDETGQPVRIRPSDYSEMPLGVLFETYPYQRVDVADVLAD